VALALLCWWCLGGCGHSGPPESGLLISGAGISANAPPWPASYVDLRQRIARYHLPAAGSEKFHHHALLSIYDHGLYLTVPANVGLDRTHHVLSSLHTHDPTGIVHMEARAPFPYTLGDFFAIWGVRFGAGTLGGLQDHGHDRVWVYVNGTLISDPARYIMRNNDDIAIGYGTQDSFSHRPAITLLKDIEKNGSALPCSATGHKQQTSCLAPSAQSSPPPHPSRAPQVTTLPAGT
jgi:hypothetical protein